MLFCEVTYAFGGLALRVAYHHERKFSLRPGKGLEAEVVAVDSFRIDLGSAVEQRLMVFVVQGDFVGGGHGDIDIAGTGVQLHLVHAVLVRDGEFITVADRHAGYAFAGGGVADKPDAVHSRLQLGIVDVRVVIERLRFGIRFRLGLGLRLRFGLRIVHGGRLFRLGFVAPCKNQGRTKEDGQKFLHIGKSTDNTYVLQVSGGR